MNETNQPASASDLPWSPSDHGVEVPDTAMLPGREKAAAAAVDLLKSAARSAHDTLDHLTDRAEPAVRRLGEGVSAAGEMLHAKTDQLREIRDEWVEGMRSTVRSNPLTSVAVALALGAAIARILRGRRP